VLFAVADGNLSDKAVRREVYRKTRRRTYDTHTKTVSGVWSSSSCPYYL